jgi:hypothetical protein
MKTATSSENEIWKIAESLSFNFTESRKTKLFLGGRQKFFYKKGSGPAFGGIGQPNIW